MPTDRELHAAHRLAQPLPPMPPHPQYIRELREALAIVAGRTLLLPTKDHLAACASSREYWKTMALALAGEGSYGLSSPAILAELRERAAQEEQQ